MALSKDWGWVSGRVVGNWRKLAFLLLIRKIPVACLFAFVFATWLLYSRQLAFAEPPKRGMRHNWNPQTGRVSVRTSLTHSKHMYTKKGLKDIKNW